MIDSINAELILKFMKGKKIGNSERINNLFPLLLLVVASKYWENVRMLINLSLDKGSIVNYISPIYNNRVAALLISFTEKFKNEEGI